ncbi:MAG: hypothetical protein K0R68_2285 [Mycobacterium sp.]|jgi:hypothetical protein|nr:hypothetical protein [Mycobacterium sp.]
MSMLGTANGPGAANVAADNVVTPQSAPGELQFVHNCSRLGLQATPPTFRLNFGWLRRR